MIIKIPFYHQLRRRKFRFSLMRKFKSDLFDDLFTSVDYSFKKRYFLKQTLLNSSKVLGSGSRDKKLTFSNVKLKTESYYLRNLISCNFVQYRRFYRRLTTYGAFLFEKQRLRSFYGEFKERYFKKLVVRFGKFFLSGMESRIDIFLFRTGLFNSYPQIKQCIKAGFISVNNKIIKDCRFFIPLNSEICLNSEIFSFVSFNKTKFWLENVWAAFSPTAYFGSSVEFSPSLGKFYIYRYVPVESIYFPFRLDLNRVLNYYTHSVKL